MIRREPRHQISFEDFFLPFGGKLSGDSLWIKLAELISWDDLEDDYASQFCKVFGAPAKPFRMACRRRSPDRLAVTDRLHGDPGFELGTVRAALAHGWEPLSGAVTRLRG